MDINLAIAMYICMYIYSYMCVSCMCMIYCKKYIATVYGVPMDCKHSTCNTDTCVFVWIRLKSPSVYLLLLCIINHTDNSVGTIYMYYIV